MRNCPKQSPCGSRTTCRRGLLTSRKPRILSLTYTGKGSLPLKYELYQYSPATGTIGKAYTNEEMTLDDDQNANEIVNRLKDILESHTIVHDGTNPIDSRNEYYLAKNGSAIKMTRGADGAVIRVQGGFQLENERKGLNEGAGMTGDAVTPANTHNLENGRTYVLDDSPIIPATTSVYGVLNEDTSYANPYRKFFELTRGDDDIIQACGLVNSKLSQNVRTRLLNKYHTFIDYGGVDYNVQFFNNYNYTVFVPSNEAIEAAEANGLPTWESIMDDYNSLPKEEIWEDSTYTVGTGKNKQTLPVLDENGDTIRVFAGYSDPILNGADSLRLQAKITYLNNFIRAHFLDNSVFADKEEMAEKDFVSSSYDNELGVFVKAHVSRISGGGGTIMQVRDDHGGAPFTVDPEHQNIMTRDVHCVFYNKDNKSKTTKSPTGLTTMNGILLEGSSFAVVHLIHGVINHTDLVDGKYAIKWDDPNACKRYLRRYRVYQDEGTESAKAMRKEQMKNTLFIR